LWRWAARPRDRLWAPSASPRGKQQARAARGRRSAAMSDGSRTRGTSREAPEASGKRTRTEGHGHPSRIAGERMGASARAGPMRRRSGPSRVRMRLSYFFPFFFGDDLSSEIFDFALSLVGSSASDFSYAAIAFFLSPAVA